MYVGSLLGIITLISTSGFGGWITGFVGPSMTRGRVEHKDIVPMAWGYLVANCIAILVSMPWWSAIGLIS